MSWQDAVIGVGQLIFIAALIPMIKSRKKPPLSTSVPTAIVLSIFSITFTTLSLWLTALASMASAITWAVIAIQEVIRQRRLL